MKEITNIKKIKIFKGIDEPDIVALLRCFSVRLINFKKNDIIIHQNDRIDFFYIIIDGNARCNIYDNDGNVITFVDFNNYDIYGLDSLTGNRKTSSYDLIATENTTVLLIDSFRLLNPCHNLCRRHFIAMQNVFIQLAKQNNKLGKQITNINMRSTKKKILFYLNHVSINKKTKEFDIPLSRQELADYLGVERSALSKELSDLQKENLISYNRNHFILKH